MAHPRTVRLEFSHEFLYHGADSVLTVTAVANLPVAQVGNSGTGQTLTDGNVITGDAAAFDVPNPLNSGWVGSNGAPVKGWSYDVSVVVTKAGAPTIRWISTITPNSATETITPGMGATSFGDSAGGAVSVTADPNVAGAYLIGE